MSNYRVSPQAQTDLIAIWTYIAVENEAPAAADRLMDRFLEQCEVLGEHPLIGRDRPEFGAGLRTFPIGLYLLIYRPTNSGVEVVRVLHGNRDLKQFFEG